MSLSTAQPNVKHPVSVDEKHSSFMAKARRLNRTKVFHVENKRSMAASVAREVRRAPVTGVECWG
jgi:hypothetical protein